MRQRTGLVLDCYFSAPKMRWLRRNATTAGVVTTSDTWLVHQLTGEFVTDAATASRSLLTDLDTMAWDPQLLELFELSERAATRHRRQRRRRRAPPPPSASTAMVGGLIVDQQAALLAQRCLAPGTAKCTFGTGVFLLANVGTKGRAAHQRPHLFAGLEPARRQLLLHRRAVLHRRLGDPLDPGPRADRRTQRPRRRRRRRSRRHLLRPGAGRSGRALVAPDAAASFTGMTLSTNRSQLVAAVLQGLAAQTAELVSAIEGDLSAPLSTLRVDGGLTRSRRLMQATADLTQIPIEVYPSVARHRARRRGLRADGRRPRLSVATRSPTGPPADHLPPQWSADRAADFRHHWRAARRRHAAPRKAAEDP